MSATAIEKVNGYAPEPRFDPVALAEADAIRARSEAETEARLITARAEAKALEIKAAEEAERQRIINDRAAMKLQKEQADHNLKLAEAREKREEIERRTKAAREAEQAEQLAVGEQQGKREQSARSWRTAALLFAVVCAVVALPVQMSAFWSPSAPWLLVAPLVLEGGAWVVLKGAAAAVDDHRPHWHYRTIAWALAFIAAGINLSHGLHAFDIATAVGTAFASLAGPGIWDLHEHGRIRLRDGKLTRRQRRARQKAAKVEAAGKAAEQKQRAAEKEAADKAAAEKAKQLAERRAKFFPKVWEHAERLATDLGEVDVNAVWERAKLDVEGAKPGESAEVLRMRNAATARVEAAREKRPVNRSSQQVASQVPGAKKPRVYNPPARRGVRIKGDVKYTPAARRQASIAARNAAAPKDTP